MPGNESEERIRILYELGNFSLGHNQSQSVDDNNQPLLIHDQWVEKQRQIGGPLSFNLKNYSGQQLNSLGGHCCEESFSSLDQNYGQLTPRSGLSRSQSVVNQEVNTDGFMLGQQNFQARQNQLEVLDDKAGFIPHNLAPLRGLSGLKSQQEYAPADSPTLTANSERSEMTDASTEFNFVGGQQKLVRGQQTGLPQQPTSMQQPVYSDVQILQQHIMFKQLQELQKQQQLQQFGEARQPNPQNHHSPIAKQGVQYPTLINGTPVNDASQMFLNWVQRGTSPTAQQGMPNRAVFSQEQSQTLRSMPLIPQQFDASLYGTPVANARGTVGQYSHVQGMSQDSPNWLNKGSNQAQKPSIQSPASGNTYMGDPCRPSVDQAYMSQGAFMAKQGIQGKKMFGQVPFQGLNNSATLENSLLGTSHQGNVSMQDLGGKQELIGWPEVFQQKSTQHGHSQDLVSLDPMEEKILYNTDEDVWNSSFGRQSDMMSGGFGNTLEQTEYSNAFPSLQSGSWSALMQSAVAEASSSDTGLQEEWSGLTFQNTELSTDNQTSNFLESEKHQKGWSNNNLQSDSSMSSKTLLMPNDSSVSSTFPGFHPTGLQFMTKQRENLPQDDSRESVRRSPKGTSDWLESNPQPTISGGNGGQVQRIMHLDNTWAGQTNNKLSENNAHQQELASYDGVGELSGKPEGHTGEAMYKRRDYDGFPWKTAGDGGLSSFLRPTGGLVHTQSDVKSAMVRRENAHVFDAATIPAPGTTKVQESTQQLADSNQLDYSKQVAISMNSEENDKTGVKPSEMSDFSNVMHNSYRASETYGQQQNCYPRDNSYDSYNPEGLEGQEQGHPAQFKFMGDVSNNSISLDKVQLPNHQGDLRELDRSPRSLDVPGTFHRSVGSCGPNINAETSQDMLKLLPKVDQSKENITMPHFGSASFNPMYEAADAGTAQATIVPMHNQTSGSQGFSLRLSSPSQQLANSNSLFSPRTPGLNLNQGHFDPGEKKPTHISPPSVSASRELSPRGSWEDKLNISGRKNISPSLHMHQSPVATVPSSPPLARNQLPMQFMFNGPVSGPSSLASHGSAIRYPTFNVGLYQDNSRQIQTNSSAQQFLGLEAVTNTRPSNMSTMIQQSGFSVRPQSSFANAQQHLPSMELYKVPSMDPPRNATDTTSLTRQGISDLASQKAGQEPSERGQDSINSHPSEELQKLISSGILNASQVGVRNILDNTALASGSLLTHSYQQDQYKQHHGHNDSPTGSERSHESFGQSLKPSHGSHQNYSLLHQVQTLKNVETDQSSAAHEQNSMPRNAKDAGLGSAWLPRDDTKMPSFPADGRKEPRVKASSQPAAPDTPSHRMVASGQNDISSQPSGGDVMTSLAENSPGNANTVQSLFKHCTTSRNGQLSLVKPSLAFGIHSSVERLDVSDGGHGGTIWPSTTASFAASDHFSAPTQSVATGTEDKKRKPAVSQRLPWHREIAQIPTRMHNMIVAEQEWAHASNRLIEKVEDDVEMIKDVPPLYRKKRRLILTTHLMQQLFDPAPGPIFAAKAASHYDSVVCFSARLSLGDACSLTGGKRNDLPETPINASMISEELKVSDTLSTGDHRFSKAVENFVERSKKMEIDLLRLDKTASMLDLRLECHELEKVSVINRFAKYHVRTADVSGSSSGIAALRMCPQRYITPHPMPNNVPDGVQCLSL